METYELFADLLDYPRPALLHGMQDKITKIASGHPEAAALLTEFHSAILSLPSVRLEEIYANTFDFHAESSLYVGHHLFGEHFKRSILMSRLKSWYTGKSYSAGTEMPDHLSVVLRFLAFNSHDPDASEFISECLIPAVTRILAGLQDSAGPYKPVLDALLVILQLPQAVAATPGAGQ